MAREHRAKSRGAVIFVALLLLTAGAATLPAQQLEPRAYSPAPIGTNYFGLGYTYSHGSVLLDPSVPIDNVTAGINGVVPYYGRTFGLGGRLASVSVVAPYAWGSMTGDVMEVQRSITRSGLGDPQLRFATNLLGGPALTLQEYRTHQQGTTLGVSVVVVCPYGQYDPAKLINIGTNRWAFKPELGLSVPAGKWTFEAYAGVWFFTSNDDFYGGQVRKQDPLAAYQAHVVYSFNPRLWAALDFTYYEGGQTTVGGVEMQDRQGNTRGGFTVAVPVSPRHSLKLTWTDGITARIGSKFTTVGVAWQWLWFDRPKSAD
ncbi:MAG: transporter [Thermoanaerobaculaceae bacterium]|jgi:hypothetical protein|nr:transporter [Thermoanaerobaculaceae bacterium]